MSAWRPVVAQMVDANAKVTYWPTIRREGEFAWERERGLYQSADLRRWWDVGKQSASWRPATFRRQRTAAKYARVRAHNENEKQKRVVGHIEVPA